ncbi:MAG: hypothetical protein LBF64_03625, partial [Oscillospiraceae bacterium]|nr:hypothetical protein [Oscillospiraceae bacterium]
MEIIMFHGALLKRYTFSCRALPSLYYTGSALCRLYTFLAFMGTFLILGHIGNFFLFQIEMSAARGKQKQRAGHSRFP